MKNKEKLKPNRVNAPTLFVGVGGIGSRIIKGVWERCINDIRENIRFVVLDTDVNDLLKMADADIRAIQISSTNTVEDYLKHDTEARFEWFPNNKMLDYKSVSEGAGQIRAISRLALNAAIKMGKLRDLYKSIDELFLKDGGDMKQAIRIVVASTAAGGTGSGIAMETAMLIRHYVKTAYPDAAVMIRGFLIMPGVMDTVISSQSEKDSLRCNGYATIKELNAFMMRGSGFCDTVPELMRYKDLHVSIPSQSHGIEELNELPFDFCFLLDRTDSNIGNMMTLSQYIDYAAQSVYEQNIGPMRSKAASMEDNILKLCISSETLGRCRFAGMGASVLKYPYNDIRDYIALSWTRSTLIGSSADENLSEEERRELLEHSWLQYDIKYAEDRTKWEENPNRSVKDEPTLAGTYISVMTGGKESGSGNDFTYMLWEKYINPKIDMMPVKTIEIENPDGDTDKRKVMEVESPRNAKALARQYIMSIVSEMIQNRLTDMIPELNTWLDFLGKTVEGKKGYASKYNKISRLRDISISEDLVDISKNFIKSIFNSKAPIEKMDLGDYMLEKYLSLGGYAIHPNAARYLLYELSDVLKEEAVTSKRAINEEAYNNAVKEIIDGSNDNGEKRKDEQFQVLRKLGRETNLFAMCKACDDSGSTSDRGRCEELLNSYFTCVMDHIANVIKNEICNIGVPAVNRLIKSYQDFYESFESKVPSIERKKEAIVSKLTFHNGACIKYILGQKEYLDTLVSSVERPAESAESASKLYSKIFETVRNNAYIEERKSVNPFTYEMKKDIFDEVIIQYYKDLVEESCSVIDVKGVLQALKLEYNIGCVLELSKTDEEHKDEKAAVLYDNASLRRYIIDELEMCHNLASPGIIKSGHDENREVNAVTCSDSLADSDGIIIDDYLPEAVRSSAVSKYELRFFRAVYNIMPTQLAKFRAPSGGIWEDFGIDMGESSETKQAGDYFSKYRTYMDKIGADSRSNAVITPHIDTRWNSIVEMPELDLEYQKQMMRKVHKAMIYGFLYNRINMSPALDDSSDERTYQYRDSENVLHDMLVSNKTKCDVLYEVLDALYYDHLAVAIICSYVASLNKESNADGFQTYEELEFFKKAKTLKYRHFSDEKTLRETAEAVSLFTIVLMYSNSLPASCKDMPETKIMAESIVEMICGELSACTPNIDSLYAKTADILVEQFNCMIDNYMSHEPELKCGRFSERVIDLISGTVWKFLDDHNLRAYKDKMKSIDNI